MNAKGKRLAIMVLGVAGAMIALSGCRTLCEKPAMEARYYPVEMPMLERMGEPEEDPGWKGLFAQFDVAWPEGSSIRYVRGINKLRVLNTPDNHERLEAAFSEWRREAGLDTMVEVDVRFVEVGQKTLDELGDFASVAPAELERALVARHDLDINQSWKLVTRNREEAVGKRVTECIYPTEFDVVSHTNDENRVTLAVKPQSFTVREAGIILDATPWVSAGGKTIELKLEAQLVDDPTWHDYGCKVPAPDGTCCDLPMEQPIFFVRSVDTKVMLVPGETALVNGAVSKDKDGAERMLFVFVRANVVE